MSVQLHVGLWRSRWADLCWTPRSPVGPARSVHCHSEHYDSLEQSDQTSLHLQSLSISRVARGINTFATAAGVSKFPLRGESSIG